MGRLERGGGVMQRASHCGTSLELNLLTAKKEKKVLVH